MSGKEIYRIYVFRKRNRALQENFDNVRFAENYCLVIYTGSLQPKRFLSVPFSIIIYPNTNKC